MYLNRCCLFFVLVLKALSFCSSPAGVGNPRDEVQQYHENLVNFIRDFREKELNSQHNAAIAFLRFVVVDQGKIVNVSEFVPVFPERAIHRIPQDNDRRYTQVFTSLGYNQNQTDLCTYGNKEASGSYKEFFKGSHELSPNRLLNIKEMYACTEPQILFSVISNWKNSEVFFRQLFQKSIAKKIKKFGGSYDLVIEVHISSYWSPCHNCSQLISNFIQAVTTNQLCQGASAHKRIKPLNVNWVIYYSYDKEYIWPSDRVCVEGEPLFSPTVWKIKGGFCMKYESFVVQKK